MNITGTVDAVLHQKTAQIWSVPPEATVFDAITLMADKNIGALLVMKNDRLVGVFSERDYTRKIALKGRSSKQTAVGDVISTPVFSVPPGSTVEECMRVMTEHRIRHLPVMDGEKLLGVVSIGDLVNWTISAQHDALNQMADYISGKYPG
jgi:CBS domain-containing protein